MPYEGQCLCGGCKVFVNSEPLLEGLVICHCDDCSRCNGSAVTCGVPAPSDSVRAEGSVKLYTSVNASNGAIVSRWFCENCGAHLLSQQSAHPERAFVRAGIIEAFTKMPIVLEVWTKYRWPSIPAIPGALQTERLTVSQTESAELKPSEIEQSA